MPDWAQQIIETYGPGTLITIIAAFGAWVLVKAFAGQMNVGTKQGEFVTTFAANSNEERRQWQERYDAERRIWEARHNHLQAEFTTFRVEQAEKEGGLKMLQQLLNTERAERREFERAVHDDNRKLEARVDVLEKDKQAGLERIRELEGERDGLIQKMAERDARISVLETQYIEQKNRADTVNEIADRNLKAVEALSAQLNVVQMSATQPIPHDVDDTVIPETTEVTSAVVTAEEQIP